MVKKRKYGDAWKDVQIDNQFDSVFEKFIRPQEKPAKKRETPLPSPHLTPPQTDSTKKQQSREAAPIRDFNRRANSLERDALPSGLFPGTSKKLYDALYLRTRGAVQPSHQIKATKRDMMKWSGIGSQNTLDAHLRHFLKIGLLIRTFETGDNAGAIYEVLIPEEAGIKAPGPTPPHPTSPQVTSHQKLGGGSPQKMGWGGVGQPIENADTSERPNTSFNTIHDDDDGLTDLAGALRQLTKEILGGEVPNNSQERERWGECASVLVEEFKRAAERAGNVSSVPAFFAAHLRRRFAGGQTAKKAGAPNRELVKQQAAALSQEQKLRKMIKDIRLLHVGDAGYKDTDLIEDLKFKCERNQIAWDEQLVDRLIGESH